jgi:DNA-binding transcriptional ArsR family regulator
LRKVVGRAGDGAGAWPSGRGASPALHVAPETGTAYTLLLIAVAIVDRDGQRRFDAGTHWRDQAKALGPDGFIRRAERIAREAWLNLVGLVHDVPEARDAGAFLDLLRTMDAADLRTYLAGSYRRVMRRATPADTIRAALDGDADAQREFRRTSFPVMRDWQATLRWLLATDPDAVRREIVELLEPIHAALLAPIEATVAEVQRVEAGHVAEAAAITDPERLITELAPGVTYVPEVGQTEVVLVPDTIIRPAVVALDHRAAMIIVHPATRDRGAIDAPPDRLVALGKAIGDETRLRVLRVLRDGPLTGTELADRLGIPRTSLHYHLSLLRAAGLVEIALDDARYGRLRLRDEALDDLGRLLVAFVLDERTMVPGGARRASDRTTSRAG